MAVALEIGQVSGAILDRDLAQDHGVPAVGAAASFHSLRNNGAGFMRLSGGVDQISLGLSVRGSQPGDDKSGHNGVHKGY